MAAAGNNVTFSKCELEQLCGGTWLLECVADKICGVYDDSRIVSSGSLFVAIKGELADGHKHVLGAGQSGAACVIVQERPDEATLGGLSGNGCGCLLVVDSLQAFHSLARAHRRRFGNIPVVGVTGSCGKTSSKEMVSAVLSRKYGDVLKTVGNTNNFFGVPRNLLRMTDETPAAVIEQGSNHPGEIRRLASMVEPTCGLVCNIGAAHLEYFGDLLGVAEEKGDLLEALPSDGVAVVPGEAEGLEIVLKHAGERRVVTFGSGAGNDVRGEYLGVVEGGYGLRLSVKATGEAVELVWGIGGRHQAINAAGAAAVGLVHGMGLSGVAEGLKQCELPGARMRVELIDGVNWVNDSYNANPNSMRASLDWFEEITKTAVAKTLVLGEMKELGASVAAAHETLLSYVAEHFSDARVVTVGKAFESYAVEHGFAYFDTAVEAKQALSGTFKAGEWVLLKGSNSVGLSCLLPADAH